MQRESDRLTPLYARLLLRLTRPFPNFDVAFIGPLRARATQAMHLRAGDRVLDVGCGIGGSFLFLADAVGPSGEVLGVEISPATVAHAQRRIETNRWTNVHVVQGAAQTVRLAGWYDGLIMFGAPDVYASAKALENILPHLRVGARIVLFGARTTNGVAGKLLNPMLKLAVSKLSFATTPLPDAEPWHLVRAVTENLEIREYFFGAMFLAAGSLAQNWTAALKDAVTNKSGA
ncbi:MAG: methyltransferase domain-containing protein [Chthoniobacterales bacterium]|nr:methyltransferase domain-containing protein [Chthoniobacterales bacterium]